MRTWQETREHLLVNTLLAQPVCNEFQRWKLLIEEGIQISVEQHVFKETADICWPESR